MSVWICLKASYAIFKDGHTCKQWSPYTILLAFLSAADFTLTKQGGGRKWNRKKLKSFHGFFFKNDFLHVSNNKCTFQEKVAKNIQNGDL